MIRMKKRTKLGFWVTKCEPELPECLKLGKNRLSRLEIRSALENAHAIYECAKLPAFPEVLFSDLKFNMIAKSLGLWNCQFLSAKELEHLEYLTNCYFRPLCENPIFPEKRMEKDL